jgi:formylglycine-generating enzyme required for sulfatase activity
MRNFLILIVTITYICPIYAQIQPQENDNWINPKDNMKFSWIPAGSFMAEIPYDSSGTVKYYSEKIEIPNGFWFGDTEVTIRQFKEFTKATGYITDGEKENHRFTWKKPGFKQNNNHPVVFVSYKDALAYAEWAGVELPLEIEWLHASQGGVSTKFYWGDEFDKKYVWYRGNSVTGTKPVGKKPPNQYGLYDIVGNVWEYVQVCDSIFALRGASWTRCNEARGWWGPMYGDVILGAVRPRLSHCKHTPFQPYNRDDDRGFRCVKRVETGPTKVQ